jgi:hypothetical protein
VARTISGIAIAREASSELLGSHSVGFRSSPSLRIGLDNDHEFLRFDSSWWDWRCFVPCLAGHWASMESRCCFAPVRPGEGVRLREIAIAFPAASHSVLTGAAAQGGWSCGAAVVGAAAARARLGSEGLARSVPHSALFLRRKARGLNCTGLVRASWPTVLARRRERSSKSPGRVMAKMECFLDRNR